MIKVVTEVLMERDNVSVILLLIISARLVLDVAFALFSRIRSNTTMVSLMEYQTIVSIHAIKVLPTGINELATT